MSCVFELVHRLDDSAQLSELQLRGHRHSERLGHLLVANAGSSHLSQQCRTSSSERTSSHEHRCKSCDLGTQMDCGACAFHRVLGLESHFIQNVAELDDCQLGLGPPPLSP